MKKNGFWTILDHLEEGITLFFFGIMCVFVFLQLFFRIVVNRPLLFPEEISRFSYVWMTFIGLSFATRTRDHIRVDFFVQLLPSLPRRVVTALVDLGSLVLLLVLAWLGYRFLLFSRMSITPALELPMNVVYVSFPLGCLMSAVRLAGNVVSDLRLPDRRTAGGQA